VSAGQRDLHVVMLGLLADRPDGLTARELAEVIARRGLYVGRRSGRPPSAGQVSARASNHRELFERGDGRIRARGGSGA
jgi:hypothetical protein